MRKVVIVGTGPAGYSAGIYTARAELSPLLFSGQQLGGQLTQTTDVENYPAFPDGVVGPQLMEDMRKQAVKFGAEIVYDEVVGLSKAGDVIKVESASGSVYEAKAVIIATGAKPRMLGVGEERYIGRGVSMCAVCDAAFFKDKRVFVVGGGDVAIEDALALSKFASKVSMLVRRDAFRASKAMQRKVLGGDGGGNGVVDVWWNTEVVGVDGDERLREIVIRRNGAEERVDADGLFLAIGHVPATGWLKGSGVELDGSGYVKVGLSTKGLSVKYPMMTSVEGVFAAGDVVDFKYQQAVTASGLGVMAGLDAERWLESVGLGDGDGESDDINNL